MIMYNPFWKKAKSTVMPEIFNDKYLKQENFETVKFWQAFSTVDAEKASANLKITIPGWLESMITSGSTTADTVYTFNPDYIIGCIFDSRACKTIFQLEDARTTGIEARKNYLNTWFDFVKSNICNPTQNFVLFVMSENEQATETFTGDGTEDDFVLTGNVARILSVTVNGTATTAYTYDADTQTVTFTSAPAASASIKITYLVDQHPSA